MIEEEELEHFRHVSFLLKLLPKLSNVHARDFALKSLIDLFYNSISKGETFYIPCLVIQKLISLLKSTTSSSKRLMAQSDSISQLSCLILLILVPLVQDCSHNNHPNKRMTLEGILSLEGVWCLRLCQMIINRACQHLILNFWWNPLSIQNNKKAISKPDNDDMMTSTDSNEDNDGSKNDGESVPIVTQRLFYESFERGFSVFF